jgi:signal transduction histidine kinase
MTRRSAALDLADLARRAAREPALEGVEATVAAPEAAPMAGDPDLLSRVLRNLLANAAQAERAVGRRGPIEVTVEAAEAGAWRLAVADRGPGVPAELAGRLFDPFVTGRPGGAGLGLALCRRIVLLHGGEIDVHPRAGGGTVAEVRLPVGESVT